MVGMFVSQVCAQCVLDNFPHFCYIFNGLCNHFFGDLVLVLQHMDAELNEALRQLDPQVIFLQQLRPKSNQVPVMSAAILTDVNCTK